jgi:hypothetical protein
MSARRTVFVSLMFAAALVVSPNSIFAHRLDEYLQATRLSIRTDGIEVELDLTPGVAVAQQVFALIDTNHDGEISSAEAEAYARLVLNSIDVAVDGRPVGLQLTSQSVPQLSDMTQGVGTIRLQASAKFARVAAGAHRVYYRNMHQANIGAYLVNALVPEDKHIQIQRQSRDYQQHELTLEYEVVTSSEWSSMWWVGAGLAMICCLAVSRRGARYWLGGLYVMPKLSLPAATLDNTFRSSE